jgi:GNAT superfamily N-acetyltransferase
MQYRADTLGNSTHYLARVRELNKKSWPEFLLYGDTPSWERIYDELADFLLLLIDSNDNLAGAGFTIAVLWDGKIGSLPDSIETIIANGLKTKDKSPNTLMAVAALVDNRYRGQNLSAEILKQMKQLAKRHGLKDLLVPVRPIWKSRYPLQSIDGYAGWRRSDGLFYDPWLRTHQRLGGKIIKCVDSTYKVEGSIEDWQTWTGMVFPETGNYIVEGALEPVAIDVESNIGVYHDPNVWMQHKVS